MRIMDDRAEVTKLQKGHGEWNEDMLDVRTTVCHTHLSNHHICVCMHGREYNNILDILCKYHATSIIRIDGISMSCIKWVVVGVSHLSLCGSPSCSGYLSTLLYYIALHMQSLGQTGVVQHVDVVGDARVLVKGRAWWFNSECLSAVGSDSGDGCEETQSGRYA